MELGKSSTGRWNIALAGVSIQFLLGTVYAWSVFKTPLLGMTGWTEVDLGFPMTLAQQVTFTFSLTIFFLGFSAALGGRLVDKAGTRKVATVAAVLFGLGTMLAGLAVSIKSMWLLWLGYGVIAGIGNGLGYVTPVAVLLRWFPDKKGMITGMAVMGFGLGAALMGQVAPALNKFWGVSQTFYVCGGLFLLGIAAAAQKLINPPADYSIAPKGAAPAKAVVSLNLPQARRRYQFYVLWGILLLNVMAGIAIISNLSPMAERLLKDSIKLGSLPPGTDIALFAGTIVFATQLFNGVGRMFWGTLSEKIGRKTAFMLIFATQVPLFFLLPHLSNVWLFTAAACWIMLCYGGGFGTMPSFAAETFGPKNIGSIYGMILFAWGVAGGIGPTMMEWIKTSTNSFDVALYAGGGVLALGFLLTLAYRKPLLQEVKQASVSEQELRPASIASRPQSDSPVGRG